MFEFVDLNNFRSGIPLTLKVRHNDGKIDTIICEHSYNELQIGWFKAGSAINLVNKKGLAWVFIKLIIL